ncbi:hypothetical protein ACIQZO_28895 [Streptomyces sp. NPDC097617]|uniref:hypothetical protein n=1 Tax=Streptomyces sp. NPDC097617 TaxID=3366091 RepID=UPI0038203A0C
MPLSTFSSWRNFAGTCLPARRTGLPPRELASGELIAMPGGRLLGWARRNLTEPRIAVALVIVGAPATLAGAWLNVLPVPGFPVLAIGLAALITGLTMLGSWACRG